MTSLIQLFKLKFSNSYFKGILGGIYTIEDNIGTGAFSTVHICRNRASNQEFAVKIVNKDNFESLTEVEILRNLSHRNIIQYVDHADTHDKRFIVMEYVKGETLHHAMCRMQFPERDAAFVMNNLMQALSYLHNLNIVHGDISTSNIFIEFSGNTISKLKLGDFGAAKKLEDGIQVEYCGTDGFMAPEIKLPSQHDGILPVYNFKVDIYSAGIILVCLFIHSTQFIVDVNIATVTNYIPSIRHHAVRELALKMIEVNPLQRLSAENVLNDPWMLCYVR